MSNFGRDLTTRYRGFHSADGPHVVREDGAGMVTPIGDDFVEWGIDSDGADRLSKALLADAFGAAEADSLFIHFKFDVVIDLDESWILTAGDLVSWLDGYSEE